MSKEIDNQLKEISQRMQNCSVKCTCCSDGIKCLPVKVILKCNGELVESFRANYGSKLIPDVGCYYNYDNHEYLVSSVTEKDPTRTDLREAKYIKIYHINLKLMK